MRKRSRLSLAAAVCAVLLLAASCGGQKEEKAADARIEFLTGEEHDFGAYSERDTMRFAFVFRNIGPEAFVITRVEPSCHCTRAEYSKEPVQPGQTDSIVVSYDGNGFVPGFFVKRCDIYSNTDTVYHLRIHGKYLEKE